MSKILAPEQVVIPPGFRIEKNPNENETVYVTVEKGEQTIYLLIAPAIMFRFRLPIIGALNKYINYSVELIKEHIEQIDIELELVERFFVKNYTKEIMMAKLRPMYDKYEAVNVGQSLGEIKMSYPEFIKFLGFIKYLSYEPMIDDDKNHLF